MTLSKRPVNLIAALVIQNGKPFEIHDYHDGDVESGPYSLTFYGYRWGKLHLTLSPNGHVCIDAEDWVYWPQHNVKFKASRYGRTLDPNAVGYVTITNKLYELRKQYHINSIDVSITRIS